MSGLSGKRIVLGVSGGIAAYKAAVLARLFIKAGAEVKTVFTQGAKAFIAPLTFQAITGKTVASDLLDEQAEAGMGHIELARWADLLIIAPCTADLLARLSQGRADCLLTTLCLATPAPVYLAPAMNQAMWAHPATQANLTTAAKFGYRVLPPAEGEQACGDIGAGRLPEPEEIFTFLEKQQVGVNQPANQLGKGLTVTITAGPTQEALDPVRYLTNHSSGKMGYALAEAALAMGAEVNLITGPVSLLPPAQAKVSQVVSADDMLTACQAALSSTDVFIACAAVADFKAANPANQKMKKEEGQNKLTLELVKNPDILATIAASSNKPFCVGFAAETNDLAANAQKKLHSKNLDALVANDVSRAGLGFGSDNNAVTFYSRVVSSNEVTSEDLGPESKSTLAMKLLERIFKQYQETTNAQQQA